MLPHEEYLLRAIQSCDFRMIGLVRDLGSIYTSTMAARDECKDFEKVLRIGRAISRCADEIADIQGDNPVSGGHCDEIVL